LKDCGAGWGKKKPLKGSSRGSNMHLQWGRWLKAPGIIYMKMKRQIQTVSKCTIQRIAFKGTDALLLSKNIGIKTLKAKKDPVENFAGVLL
jgi:hypothetical protein